jgi:ubiquinone biosynthesis protein Coq4
LILPAAAITNKALEELEDTLSWAVRACREITTLFEVRWAMMW